MFSKLVRIGRDAELRSTPGGKSVCNFPAVYDIGYGDKKRPQWIDCALWGDRANNVSSMLTKGVQVVIYADDIEVELYRKNDDKAGAKLKCRIVNFEFAGPRNDQNNQQPAQRQSAPAPQPQAAPQQNPSHMADDFDDDIPF